MKNKTTFEQVKEFHNKFGHAVEEFTSSPDADTINLRLSLILEEVTELIEAFGNSDSKNIAHALSMINAGHDIIKNLDEEDYETDIVEVADALGDIKYVVDGAALVCGIPLDKVSAEIHRSNMSKLGADGKVVYDNRGKVQKGPNYFKPNIISQLNIRAVSSDKIGELV